MNRNSGLTITELLVVLVITGILAAIAFPTLVDLIEIAIGQNNVQIIKNAIDSQQVQYIEVGSFSKNWENLNVGQNKTETHEFKIDEQSNNEYSIIKGIPKHESVKGYISAVEVVKNKKELYFKAVICEARKPGVKAFEKVEIEFKKRRIKCEHSKKVS